MPPGAIQPPIYHRFTDAVAIRPLDQDILNKLQTLDFKDKQAVENLHKAIANTTLIEKICDVLFHKGELKKCREDYTTFLFLQHAAKYEQPTDFIPGSRKEALETIATCLAPVAQEALLAAMEDRRISNEFTQLLDRSDLCYLAAQVLLVQEADLLAPNEPIGPGKMSHSQWKLVKAADYFQSAGFHYNEANNPTLAIVSYQLAQKYYGDTGCLRDVATNKHAVAGVLVKQGEYTRAAAAFDDAAEAYLAAAAKLRVKGEKEEFTVRLYTENAAKMFKLGAKFLEKDNKPVEAGDYYLKCARLYEATGKSPERAEKYYQRAAACYNTGHEAEKHRMAMELAHNVRQPRAAVTERGTRQGPDERVGPQVTLPARATDA